MKIHSIRLLVCSVLACANLSAIAQSPAPEMRISAAAVVVSNIDNSVRWYQSVFGVKVKTTMNDPNNTYKVVILESSSMMFELMQLKGSVVRSEALKGKPEGTQIQGHFKIGFTVKDLDACLRHLKALKVDVPQVWTDSATGKRNFLITDPDGNLIQFFD
jgi:glyoxylase I family protein